MRASTRVSKFQGLDAKLVEANGRLINKFEGGTGKEKTTSVSNYLLDATIPSSVDPMTYAVLTGLYAQRGANERYSRVLALLTIDSAKLQGVSPLSIVPKLSQGNLSFSDELLYLINLLGDTSTRLARTTTVSNSRSFKSSYIKP